MHKLNKQTTLICKAAAFNPKQETTQELEIIHIFGTLNLQRSTLTKK